MMTFIHIIPDPRTVFICHLYRPTTDFGKRSLKLFRAAKYYTELPADIKFELDDSEKYNKSVLKNYLFNTELTLLHLTTFTQNQTT